KPALTKFPPAATIVPPPVPVTLLFPLLQPPQVRTASATAMRALIDSSHDLEAQRGSPLSRFRDWLPLRVIRMTSRPGACLYLEPGWDEPAAAALGDNNPMGSILWSGEDRFLGACRPSLAFDGIAVCEGGCE